MRSFEFYWSEYFLYKKFRDFQKDIGHTSNETIHNRNNLQYIPWHVDPKGVTMDSRVESNKEEKHPNLQRVLGNMNGKSYVDYLKINL